MHWSPLTKSQVFAGVHVLWSWWGNTQLEVDLFLCNGDEAEDGGWFNWDEVGVGRVGSNDVFTACWDF